MFFFHGNSNLPPTVTELFNITVASAADSLGTEHPCLGQQQLLESFLLSRWWHSAKGTEGDPRGRTSKKDLECVESCKRDEKKLRLLSRWGSLGAKIGLWKKTGSYRDLNQNFGRFPWISTDMGSAESHGFGWQQLCYSSVTIGIFREQLCIVSGLQFSFQPTDSWEKMAIDSIRQAQILPMEVEDPLKCENDGGYAG